MLHVIKIENPSHKFRRMKEMYVRNVAKDKFPRPCECNVDGMQKKRSQGRCVYVVRYIAQSMRSKVQPVKQLEEREQTPLERSKRRRVEQDIKVSRGVKRLDDASAFVGREDNLCTGSKREVRKVCAVGKRQNSERQSVSKSMFQEGVIERKMQQVKETHSAGRAHPSCYAIPT